MSKNEEYYKCLRDEMLEFIPPNSKKILDIGCGEGNFGIALKNNLNSEVWGIEINENAGKIAQKYLDKVIISDVFDSLSVLPDNYFDCLVFNDSLEHLKNPYKLLREIGTKLSSNGVIISSIPNVRYIKNLFELLIKKDWKYRDEGILDFTHLRFFTKKSIIEMFESNGYEINRIRGINPFKKRLFFNLFNLITLGLFYDTQFLQYAVVAKKIPL